jgi:hypothetical protein
MRRTVIALVFGLAGCLGSAPTGTGMNPTPTPTPNPTPDPGTTQPAPTPAPAPAPAPTPTGAAEIAKFGKCMLAADWTSSGMSDLQNQTTAGYGGECYSCHATGMYGTYLSKVATDNMTMWKTSPWVEKFATASVNPDGSFADIIPTNRFRDRGVEAGHPAYQLTDARTTALTNFFMLTYTHYKAGNCP